MGYLFVDNDQIGNDPVGRTGLISGGKCGFQCGQIIDGADILAPHAIDGIGEAITFRIVAVGNQNARVLETTGTRTDCATDDRQKRLPIPR